MTPALALRAASVDRGRRRVLDAVTLEVSAGEVLGVVGPNGAGKTTLLRAALGLARLTAGRAELGGRDVATVPEVQRARLAGYLPQERRVGWNLPAWQVAALGAVHLAPSAAHAAALKALAAVDAADLADRGVLDMSGGERARVLLARLLTTSAPLLVADEPAAGLDPDAQILALERLRARAEGGVAVVVTLHDLSLAARFCDRLAVLGHGRLAALDAPAAALSSKVLAEVFSLDGALVDTPAGLVLAAQRKH